MTNKKCKSEMIVDNCVLIVMLPLLAIQDKPLLRAIKKSKCGILECVLSGEIEKSDDREILKKNFKIEIEQAEDYDSVVRDCPLGKQLERKYRTGKITKKEYYKELKYYDKVQAYFCKRCDVILITDDEKLKKLCKKKGIKHISLGDLFLWWIEEGYLFKDEARKYAEHIADKSGSFNKKNYPQWLEKLN